MREATASGHVTFTGQVPYPEIPELFKTHDLFLMTSDYEGLPMSLVEAMAYGMVPVVSNLESGMCEVVDKTNGALVPPTSPANYAEAIIGLHNNRHVLDSLSNSAVQKIHEGYSVETMTSNFLFELPSPVEVVTWEKDARIHAPKLIDKWWRFRLPLRGIRRLAAKIMHA